MKARRKPPKGNPVISRMSDALRDMLDAAAKANLRSRSKEIIHRLEASFEGQSIDKHGVIVEQRSRSAK
ncbi:hypothetical protein MCEMSHM24_02714 [Comamonadaceae bacterium]